jgi:hypothetical protein
MRFWVAIASGLLLGGLAVGGFGPCIRSKVREKAEQYGAEVEVQHVLPSWRGVRLRGVVVRLREVPGVRLWLDDVVVGWGGDHAVETAGGKIEAVGPVGELVQQVERWRAARLSGAGKGGGGGGRRLAFEGFEIDWRDRVEDPRASLRAAKVRLSRDDGGISFEAEQAKAESGATRVAVEGVRLSLARRDGALRIRELSTRSLLLEHRWGAPEKGEQGAAQPPAEEPSGKSAKDATRPAVHQRVERVRRLHAWLLTAARQLDELVDGDAAVAVGGARAKLAIGDDLLNLGPGTLGVRRDGGVLVVALDPELDTLREGSRALSFSMRVPLKGEGPIDAELRGGPLWLSMLGVQEGDLGLRHVDQAAIESHVRLRLPPDGGTISLDGRGKLHDLSLASKRIADGPLEGIELAWRARLDARVDGSEVTIHEAEVDLGALRTLFHGSYKRGEQGGHAVDVELEMPLVSCQAAFDSLPKAVVKRIAGMRFAGSLAVKGHARFDSADLGRHYDVDFDGSNSCRIVEVPPKLSVARFRERFDKLVYGPDGDKTSMEFGPETDSWVPYTSVSHFMEGAVLTTEDGRFHRHRGFDKEAIVNSLRENLKAKRFVRGASTISMQLAKNLYLPREKTIARKLQEAVLTMYLEQELTKQEIMELYLNVIEFGPMIYGIGPAARHYFSTSPGRLSLGQALYLASILSNPKIQHFGAGGAVTPKHMGYLHTLMKIVHKIRRISDEELADGLRETVVFGSPAPLRSSAEEEPFDHYVGPEPDPYEARPPP